MNNKLRSHIVITGSNGYIGSALLNYLIKKNKYRISVLSSKLINTQNSEVEYYKWNLCDPIPLKFKNMNDKICLIHLAHDWQDLTKGKSNINYRGTIKLFNDAKKFNIKKIIFASSLSSFIDSPNVYGKIKNQIEADIEKDIIILRIGVIFGGASLGQWGLLKKLCQLPFLPMIGLSNKIHTIHIDDLCNNIYNIIENKFEFKNPIYLANGKSITFETFLKFISSIYHQKKIYLISIPDGLIKLFLKIFDKFYIFNFISERIRGLQNSKDQDEFILSQKNKIFVRNIDHFIKRKNDIQNIKFSLIEAYILFKYLDGGKPKFSYLKAYVKVTLKKFKPYKFLKVIIYFPFLFKLIDPIKKVATSNINEKCYIMMLIIETQMKKEQQFLSFLKLVYFIPVDIIIYPIRVFFSLILWRKTNE